jgi:pimeloyl-ACP methyl ester carboxylesterase
MGSDLARNVEMFMPVPGSRSVLVDGTGHFLHLEAPPVVNAHILEFLKR